MNEPNDRIKAMQYSCPQYIPVAVGLMPATWMKYRDELDALVRRHPIIFGDVQARNYDDVGGTYVAGEHVDDWGCVWSNVQTGMEAIVTRHPVPTRADVHTLKPPSQVRNGFEHGFMYLRLADLRGFEELMLDFAEEPPELQMLIDVVLEHNQRKLEKLLPTTKAPDFIGFGDDLGIQTSLPMSPEKWRKYLKPCFTKLYQQCRQAGFWVYMHTDGHIYEIIPDLAECGVNVVNPQVRANGLDNLARVCKGKVCLNLDLDRQMFPFCSPRDIDEHVHEAVAKLGMREGGLWLAASIAPDVPLEIIEAICVALEKYRGYFQR